MPNPLIIFESHMSAASREFVAQNAASLRKMGYTKFLLEMNSEISPALLKLQINAILRNPKASVHHTSSKALLDMLVNLEKNDISYEFIDPETQEEASQINMELQSSERLGATQLARVVAKRQQLTNQRDEVMSTIIIEQTKRYHGGVIFFGGFSHKHLVKQLELSQSNFYRYALFANSSKDKKSLSDVSVSVNGDWDLLPNEHFRTQFLMPVYRILIWVRPNSHLLK